MPDGKSVAHAELMIGDSKIMLSDEFPEMKCLSPKSIGGSPVSLYLYVEDVDKTFNLAVSEGGKSLFPVQDQFYGDRHGSIQDPFGHIWSIGTGNQSCLRTKTFVPRVDWCGEPKAS
jgi:PhnB protein